MKPQLFNTRQLNIFWAVVAIAILLTGAYLFTAYLLRGNSYEETNDAQVESHINPVSARVGANIKEVKFNEHELVKAGDTLVLLDDREYREKLIQAEAAVEDAFAQLDVLAAGIHSAKTATLVNKDQIDGAKARLLQQEQDIRRYKNLIKEEATTKSDLDLVQSKYDVAVSDYHASISNLKTSYARISELRARRKLLLADLKRKKADLQLARINMGYTTVSAPYSGKLGRKTILEGQQIQPGQPLVSIVDEKEKWVTANFKETQVGEMHIGQPVEIRIDAFRNKVFNGNIEAISASTGAKFSLLPPDNSTGNFVKIVQRVPVKIKFTSKDIEAVKAGMNVTVSVKNK